MEELHPLLWNFGKAEIPHFPHNDKDMCFIDRKRQEIRIEIRKYESLILNTLTPCSMAVYGTRLQRMKDQSIVELPGVHIKVTSH